MPIEELGPGSVATADVRRELNEVVLPAGTKFVVRASHVGPQAVTTLAIDLYRSPIPPVEAQNGWMVVPIDRQLAVGQRLGWSVWAGFAVPRMAAYLLTRGKVRFLGRKGDLAAGGLWASGVVLRQHHLAAED